MGRAGSALPSAEMHRAEGHVQGHQAGPKRARPDVYPNFYNLFVYSFIHLFIYSFFFHEIFGYSLLVLDIELALGNIIPTAYVFK